VGLAKAKYYLLLCDAVSGAEAERIGLVSLAVEDSELDAKALEVAVRLAEGAQSAIRWTKYALNNWLRMAGPSFDASLALEFMGFSGPEAIDGLASHKEKRRPSFPSSDPQQPRPRVITISDIIGTGNANAIGHPPENVIWASANLM